jgi:hypothetical protein
MYWIQEKGNWITITNVKPSPITLSEFIETETVPTVAGTAYAITQIRRCRADENGYLLDLSILTEEGKRDVVAHERILATLTVDQESYEYLRLRGYNIKDAETPPPSDNEGTLL